MEFMFDTANLALIRQYEERLPYVGVTTNPALLRKEGKVNFFSHFREIRSIIGANRSLHMQVVSHDADTMVKEAETILRGVDREVYIKIPVTLEGLKAMRVLKSRGVHITATTVVTPMQALLALAADADYIAPYCYQIDESGTDANALVRLLADTIARDGRSTKILAANIKNTTQVRELFQSGSQVITLNPTLLADALKVSPIEDAVRVFDEAWAEIYGTESLTEFRQ